MQTRFDFCGRSEIGQWRAALEPLLADVEMMPRRKPIGTLVKSLISGRTRDEVSFRAYRRLRERYRSAAGIAAAKPAAVEAVIAEVTFPEAKAEWLVATLQRIGREQPDYCLDFLGGLPLEDALAWLERHPGVGRKVAASTLNASTLDRPVLIVDSHVLRVLRRLGFVAANADARTASEAATAAMPGWSGEEWLRFHIATKRLGQLACHAATPDCGACPLAKDCPGRLTR
jgi:endonuclease III